MSDTVNILQRAESVEVSPTFGTYSKVIINIDDNTQKSYGTDTGRTLELDNPLFGSAAVAKKTLARLKGYQYQPFTATKALIDPAAEMGDGLSVNGIYGGIYTRERSFGRLMAADVSAPHDEEIDHEYKFEPQSERTMKREMEDMRATIRVQANEISAKVSQTGGKNSTFGWTLTSTAHTWYSGSKAVMKVDKDGLEVSGKITATSGYIGSASKGFAISASSISNGMTSLGDTENNGVYISTSGIALGAGKFKVTSAGALTATNITATNLKLKGTLTFYNTDGTSAGTLTAANLRLGAQRANTGYPSWNAAATSTSAGGYCYTGAANGNSAKTFTDNASNRNVGVSILKAAALIGNTLSVNGYQAMWSTRSVLNGDGNPITIHYLGYSD